MGKTLQAAGKRCVTLDGAGVRVVMALAMAYLVIPQLLFEAVAFRPVAAAVFAGGGLVMLALGVRAIPRLDVRIELPLYVLAVSGAVLFIVLLFSGMGGITGVQSSDYGRINAILCDMVRYDWPVLYDEGANVSVLNYYIAWFVPCALVGKLCGGSFAAAQLASLLWSALGLWLGMLLMYIVTGVAKLRTLWVFLCWAGLDCVGSVIIDGSLFYGTRHLEHWASIARDHGNGHIANYMSTASNLNFSPHLFIPVVLFIGFVLLMVRHRHYTLCILMTASLLFWSPLVAIGAVPFAVVLLAYEKGRVAKFLSVPDVLSLGLAVLPMALYYTSMDLSAAGGQGAVFRGPDWLLDNWTIVLLFIVLEFGIVGYILYRSLPGEQTLDRLLCATSLVFMALCLLVDYGRCHDFSMRATTISWMILFTFAPRLLVGEHLYRNALILYMAGATVTSCTEYARMLDGVLETGFPAGGTTGKSYTLRGWPVAYQYMGMPDAFFFTKLTRVDFDAQRHDAALHDSAPFTLHEEGRWSVYAYRGEFYVYDADAGDGEVTVTVAVEGGSAALFGGRSDETQAAFTPGATNTYGTLSRFTGLVRFAPAGYDFDALSFTMADAQGQAVLRLTKEDVLLAMHRSFTEGLAEGEACTASASTLTDANWEAGVSRSRPELLLFKNNFRALSVLYGARELEANGEVFTVTSLEYDHSWIHVTLDRDARACAGPTVVQVR